MCVYVYIYVYMYRCSYICIYIYIYMYIYMYIYIYIHIAIVMCIYIYIYMYLYMCTYIHVYIYIEREREIHAHIHIICTEYVISWYIIITHITLYHVVPCAGPRRARLHPVRLARIRCPGYSSKGWVAQALFVVIRQQQNDLLSALRMSKGWVQSDTNRRQQTGCRQA